MSDKYGQQIQISQIPVHAVICIITPVTFSYIRQAEQFACCPRPPLKAISDSHTAHNTVTV